MSIRSIIKQKFSKQIKEPEIENYIEIIRNKKEEVTEYEVVEKEILPEKMICPDCGGITLVGLDFCDKCGGELIYREN